MKVNAPKGEIVTDFLYKQLGQDDDKLEADFYRLNPHVRAEVFLDDTLVSLPKLSHQSNQKTVTRSWD